MGAFEGVVVSNVTAGQLKAAIDGELRRGDLIMTDGEGRFFVAPRVPIKLLAPIWYAKEKATEAWRAQCLLYGIPRPTTPKRYSGNSRDRRRQRRADLKRMGLL